MITSSPSLNHRAAGGARSDRTLTGMLAPGNFNLNLKLKSLSHWHAGGPPGDRTESAAGLGAYSESESALLLRLARPVGGPAGLSSLELFRVNGAAAEPQAHWQAHRRHCQARTELVLFNLKLAAHCLTAH